MDWVAMVEQLRAELHATRMALAIAIGVMGPDQLVAYAAECDRQNVKMPDD